MPKSKRIQRGEAVMVPANASEALRHLDSRIWVEDRLFATRLIVLDRLNDGSAAQNFAKTIACWLPQDVRSIRPPDYQDNWFELVAYEAGITFMGTPARPATLLEQFFNDLNTYGLRESLAYLYDIVSPRVDSSLHDIISNGYLQIAQAYIDKREQIKRRFEEIWDSFTGKNKIRWRDRFEPAHHRMIVAWGACSEGDFWSDGFPQIRG
jgi:hypothetical protein